MLQVRQSELMDDPGLERSLHLAALRDLDRLNRVSFTSELIWREIQKNIGAKRSLSILDVASGSGTIAARISELSRRRGFDVAVDVCDISDTAMSHAAEQHGNLLRRAFKLDVLRVPIPTGYDVIICSLFLHHLNEADASTLLRKITAAATDAAIISDLERSRMGYVLAFAATHLLTRSPIVKVDSLRSVKNAYTKTEIQELIKKAGIKDVTVRRAFPCRLMIVGRRQSLTSTH
jgi:2-polyprenyl-3-methyl-5-hydroxy-6-metoxy-1,4-benzoquinol methylase